MKKALSIFLCLALLLLMPGCRSGEAEPVTALVPETTAAPVADATESPATEAPTEPATEPTTAPTEPPRPWLENVMMADHVEYPDPLYVLGNEALNRGNIKSVAFLDTLADMPEDAWDVSEAQNGSVMAWVTEGNSLYIAGEGGVMAPADCSNLFFCYTAKTIDFNGNFHMENVENMSAMFMMSMVEELDFTGMDLSNVRRMDWCLSASVLTNVSMPDLDLPKLERVDYLFENNFELETVDLSGWNTPSLTNMEGMFYESKTVREINLSGWNTSGVTNMAEMFVKCKALEQLDLSGWDTSSVTDMSYMFFDTGLTELDISHFDTSSVTNMQEMFRYADVKTLELGEWETDSVESYKDFLPSNFKVDGKDWKELFN